MVESNQAAEFLDEKECAEAPEDERRIGDSFAFASPTECGEQKTGENPEPPREDQGGRAGIGLKPKYKSSGDAEADRPAGDDYLEPD